jgi:hemin uptake protein HemP
MSRLRETPDESRLVQSRETGGHSPLTAPRRVYSPALFRGEREVVIIHQGQEYRLRITKADKLILTK